MAKGRSFEQSSMWMSRRESMVLGKSISFVAVVLDRNDYAYFMNCQQRNRRIYRDLGTGPPLLEIKNDNSRRDPPLRQRPIVDERLMRLILGNVVVQIIS